MSPSARPARRARSKEPREHLSAGLAWHVTLPDRTQATLGAGKPLATVEVTDQQAWQTRVPLSVARALDAHGGPEPECLAMLEQLISETARSCSRTRLVDMLSRREYSCAEASERLRRDGFAPQCVEDAVAWARKGHLIDDGRFADSFVRSKRAAGWGALRIERELRRRGVEPASVAALEQLDAQGERDRALEALRSRHIPERNAFPKLVRHLLGRGYSLDVAKQAACERLEEASEQGLV